MSNASAPVELAPASLEAACRASESIAISASTRTVELAEAHGTVLAADVFAPADFPFFDSSAMDGWALRAADASSAMELRVIGESRAGVPFEGELSTGAAVAIATGAQLPSGADSVLPIEHGCEVDRRLITGDTVTMGQHVRPAGRHAQTGNRLLTAGSIVGAGEIAVLAAFGLGTVAVRALPVATVIGGGDELTPPGEALAPGAIYDSNTPMLESLLGENGCATTARRYGTDDEGAVTELIERAVRESDFVVTCGGVSVGRHDHLPAALESLGALELVRGTTARPGLRFRLFTVSPEAGAPVPVFCLPGNPLSAWFCFQLYVRRFIAASLGIAAPRRLDAVLSTTVARAPERTKLAPGRVELQDTTAVFFPRRCASDAVTEIAGCNAYAIIEPGEIAANKGLRVECELCSG